MPSPVNSAVTSQVPVKPTVPRCVTGGDEKPRINPRKNASYKLLLWLGVTSRHHLDNSFKPLMLMGDGWDVSRAVEECTGRAVEKWTTSEG